MKSTKGREKENRMGDCYLFVVELCPKKEKRKKKKEKRKRKKERKRREKDNFRFFIRFTLEADLASVLE